MRIAPSSVSEPEHVLIQMRAAIPPQVAAAASRLQRDDRDTSSSTQTATRTSMLPSTPDEHRVHPATFRNTNRGVCVRLECLSLRRKNRRGIRDARGWYHQLFEVEVRAHFFREIKNN